MSDDNIKKYKITCYFGTTLNDFASCNKIDKLIFIPTFWNNEYIIESHFDIKELWRLNFILDIVEID